MKKALKLLLMFLIFFVIGAIGGTIFYSIYLSSLNLVVGTPAALFQTDNMAAAFFITCEILSFSLGFMLISYRLRHPGGILQLVAFILTQVICWGILFPSLFYLENRYIIKHKHEILDNEEENQLTKGYFRLYDNDVYYFMDDLKPYYSYFEDGTLTVRIDTEENGIVEIVEIKNPHVIDIASNSEPYKDILIKKSFVSNESNFLSFLYGIVNYARKNFKRGWTFWLGFISLGFALSCVYAVSMLSDWKLINFSIVSVLTAGILYWNYIYTTPVFDTFRANNFVRMNIGSLNDYVNNPFLIATNILIGIIFIVIGTITFIVRKRRSR